MTLAGMRALMGGIWLLLLAGKLPPHFGRSDRNGLMHTFQLAGSTPSAGRCAVSCTGSSSPTSRSSPGSSSCSSSSRDCCCSPASTRAWAPARSPAVARDRALPRGLAAQLEVRPGAARLVARRAARHPLRAPPEPRRSARQRPLIPPAARLGVSFRGLNGRMSIRDKQKPCVLADAGGLEPRFIECAALPA